MYKNRIYSTFYAFYRKPVSEADRPVMGKLLSYGYGKDWEDENSKYHNKLSKAQAKLEQTQIGGGGEKMQTEYQEGYKRGTGSAGKPKDRYVKKGFTCKPCMFMLPLYRLEFQMSISVCVAKSYE